MRPITRSATVAVTVAVFLTLVASPALAAPPTNDLFTGATPATPGFSETLDTTEATTDADDAQLNEDCGAPATDASVWYEFTTLEDGIALVDVGAADYSAGVAVGTGTQGSLELVECDAFGLGFEAEAGVTYFVLVFDFQEDGGGNGGQLEIAFDQAPPPPEIAVDGTAHL